MRITPKTKRVFYELLTRIRVPLQFLTCHEDEKKYASISARLPPSNVQRQWSMQQGNVSTFIYLNFGTRRFGFPQFCQKFRGVYVSNCIKSRVLNNVLNSVATVERNTKDLDVRDDELRRLRRKKEVKRRKERRKMMKKKRM